MVKRGLGRGLGSLIPGKMVDQTNLEEIPIEDISPNSSQPRQRFDEGAFAELVASVGRHGIVQPVVVRPRDGGYELIAGERRWRAAREAGLESLPALVKDADDQRSLQIALIENIQREDLNPIEEAGAYKSLLDEYGLTQAAIAEIVGKNRTTVANALRLLGLPEGVKTMIATDKVSPGHARALLVLDGPEIQQKLADKVAAERLSVRQTEELAKLWRLTQGRRAPKQTQITPEVRAVARRLVKILGTNVKVKCVRDKVKLEIEIRSPDDVRRLEELASEQAVKPD